MSKCEVKMKFFVSFYKVKIQNTNKKGSYLVQSPKSTPLVSYELPKSAITFFNSIFEKFQNDEDSNAKNLKFNLIYKFRKS